MEDMMEDEEEFEEVDGELDWSESHGESLTPSQHSQPGRGTMDEVCGDAWLLVFCLHRFQLFTNFFMLYKSGI